MTNETNYLEREGTMPPAPAERSIIVNGRPAVVLGDEIDHGRLVAIAHPAVPVGTERSFAVTWRDGPAGLPVGIASPLRRIPVVEGQRFNVAVADKS